MPTAIVVMVGAGQLAQMTQQAAIGLGVELRVLARSEHDPAIAAGARGIVAGPDLDKDVARLTAGADVITFDHELVAPALMERLVATGIPVRPSPQSFRYGQDKLFARERLSAIGVPVPAFSPVPGPVELAGFAAEHGWPVVMKTVSGGYDGRGVQVLDGVPDLAWPASLAEEHLDLAMEFAVIVARRPSGAMVSYPLIETVQRDGICTELSVPARLERDVAEHATELARSVVAGIDATGIVATEWFLTTDGRLLMNELALRPHNSGHVTIEACATSQFEQHLRAVLDWPLGATELVVPAAATVNLLGGAAPLEVIPARLAVKGAHLHWYAKVDRPGRKLGHVTATAASLGEARSIARAAARR